MINNKKSGSTFEHEFCELAYSHGFWAHMLQGNKNGQPSDVIISKNNISALIDCKVCENGMFKLSRIEENQDIAMKMWKKSGNKHAAFALKINDSVMMLDYQKTLTIRMEGIKQLHQNEILLLCIPFDVWELDL